MKARVLPVKRLARTRVAPVPFMKRSIVLLIIFGLFALTTALCRPPRPPHPGQRLDRLIEHLSKDLDLTPEQAREVEELRRGIHRRQQAMREYRRTHMEHMIATVRRDSLTIEDLRELDKQMEARHRAHKDFIMNRVVRIHGMLTPEQRGRFADRLERVHRKKMERMRRRPFEQGVPEHRIPSPPAKTGGTDLPDLPTPDQF